MKRKLRKLASIHSGYTFRSGITSSIAGAYPVIQMKDLGENGLVDCSSLAKVETARFSKGNFAEKGDLIFRSRGVSFASAILDRKMKNCVVAAPLYRVRVDDTGVVLPEYLNWYMGQSAAQSYFHRVAVGALSLMVSKDDLGRLDVTVPPIDTQRSIVQIVELSARENEIVSRIQTLRNNAVSSVLTDCIKGEL